MSVFKSGCFQQKVDVAKSVYNSIADVEKPVLFFLKNRLKIGIVDSNTESIHKQFLPNQDELRNRVKGNQDGIQKRSVSNHEKINTTLTSCLCQISILFKSRVVTSGDYSKHSMSHQDNIRKRRIPAILTYQDIIKKRQMPNY